MSRGPVVAEPETEIGTVMLVDELTTTVPTVIPAPEIDTCAP
jgi:hypothetical protein